MTEPVLLTHVADGVATLTLNRPQALNALDRDLTLALSAAVSAAELDPAVRCVVIRGGDHFMAGGDLRWFDQMIVSKPAAETRVQVEGFIREVHALIVSLRRMPKPTVASVSGAAAGFGMSLMMACDLAVAADNAYFTLAYTLIGTSPDGGSTFALPRLVGTRRAMEIALLGDRLDAATAERIGLVNRVVPAAALGDETAKLAARLAAGPAGAYARTKALIQGSLGASLETQLQREAESFASCAAEPDFAEGVRAFLDKRKARWAGTGGGG
jgi:2-(1,2-epoxy-1,2-dihydrophenyl)acetyl-CoA isomerase